jgi:UDP-N-acetylenolpyruvoylglucosamine reductase
MIGPISREMSMAPMIGGASAAEVVALRDKVTEAIKSRFGIRLEPEPVWLA